MAFSIELGLILLFSILGGVLAVRFRQPSVLGLLLVGAIVGPNTLGFIRDATLINTAIEIGAILLLFTVGIEFSLQHLLNLGLRAITIAAIKLGTVFLISYYTSFLLGLSFTASIYIAVILSITSTVIVIKILEQKGLAKREELPLLIAILIIEDIFGVFALTFFSSLNTRGDLVPINIATSLLVSLIVMAIAYVILQKALKPVISWLVKYSTEDTITFISLGLCGGMSYLALLLNLSPSVGAFLAGSIVATFPNSKVFEKAIHPFILTFTSLFFFSIGSLVNFSAIFGSIYIIIALFLVNIISKFIAIGFGSYLFTNFNGKQAVFSGLAMLSVGEFSLLIAREAGTLGLGIDLVSITAAIILLSSLAMSMSVGHSEKAYNAVARFFPARLKEEMSLTSKFLNSLSFGMLKDREGTKKVAIEWKKIFNNTLAIFTIFSILFFFWRFYHELFVSVFKSRHFINLLLVLVFAAIFLPALNILRNATNLIKDILKFFIRVYPEEVANERKIFRNLTLTAALFLVIVIFPGILVFLKLSPAFNIFMVVLLFLIIGNVLRSSTLIHNLTKKHEATFSRLSKKYKQALKKRMREGEKSNG
ncbi:cation:proton antiporter [Candidatus Woesearchaeota archaeon]|nr:cation:proton antiporter [Candidatus Woesearchaeota archaeon]